ncbi:tRNA (adenosine(37)-N6)-threonylcarbamoyltransferase complex ATPase subunit type 1 TsaE [Pleomorphomonas koreensis]|uniref:tRNA (adenosine(37)-N6)-threonylcarbamoyltransferase complex ATPase subunit type 1 TsaE n=1 Tax=Pleomorphomonas koreensis TaxID=257440 RepID=UPI00042A2EFF|nr:tRNA (adenosine(37)-N6)-threonylcarbamoyltransferase complex ATPase subunit type 1 TsaE [Pleomorphomonas koreensis]
MSGDALSVSVADEAGTRRLADDIAAIVRPGDVIALHGDLGMGKSAFARAVVRRLAGDPGLDVPSPTFTLLQGYETARFPVHHFDLYRLADPDELLEIGFADAVGEGVTLIEWPERAGGELPADRLDVIISEGEGRDGRRFALVPHGGGWAHRLDETCAVRDLLDRAGFGEASRAHLQGDASTRRFERISGGKGPAVLMRWPPFGALPIHADGLPYEALVHVTDRLDAFVAIGDTLRRHGFRAPRLLAEDAPRRILLLEDLGGEGIAPEGVADPGRYLAAARRLADMAAVAWPATATGDDGRAFPLPVYDRRALLTEVELFATWYAPDALHRPLAAAEAADWRALWDGLFARFDDDRTAWVLRDYHSPNILWQADGDPIGLIDYQDALIGPAAYDLASLVTDARVDVADDLQAALVDAYCQRRLAVAGPFDEAEFRDAVLLLGAQRNAKILGRFVRYAKLTGRSHHLRFVPRVRRNLEKALAGKVLAGVKLWYERLGLADARP